MESLLSQLQSDRDLIEIDRKADFYKFKSSSELYIYWWLEELEKKGYIEEYWYERESLTLSKEKTIQWNKKLKTKVKPQKIKIYSTTTYVPDFKIKWEPKSEGIFFVKDQTTSVRIPYFFTDDTLVSYIEVKPSQFNFQNMDRVARDRVRWAHDRLNVYIQITKPNKLFSATFYPKRYLLSDGRQSLRITNKKTLATNKKAKSLAEYIEYMS